MVAVLGLSRGPFSHGKPIPQEDGIRMKCSTSENEAANACDRVDLLQDGDEMPTRGPFVRLLALSIIVFSPCDFVWHNF